MKKSTFAIVLILFGFSATAQHFSLGFTAAKGNAWTNSRSSIYYSAFEEAMKETENAGVQMLLKTSEHIGFVSSVLYSKEGFTLNKDKKVNYTNFEMDYLRVTLQPVYYPLKSRNILQPKLSAGFSAAYLVDGVSTFTDNNGNDLAYETKEIVNSKFDFGYRLEAGIDIKVTRIIRLTTSAAYYCGTVKVPDFNRKWENRSITYNAGLLFRTSKK